MKSTKPYPYYKLFEVSSSSISDQEAWSMEPLEADDEDTVCAYCVSELRSLAPLLAALAYTSIPDKHLDAILAWAEMLETDAVEEALSIQTLEDIMPSLVIAFASSHAYSVEKTASGHALHVVDTDGCGILVVQAFSLSATYAATRHGSAGEDVERAFANGVLEKLDAILEMIIART